MAAEYVVDNQDFSEFDNNASLHLVKIDRNLTHYYVDSKCPKCGGKGYIWYYDYVEGGICFMCNGSGVHNSKLIVRTREYQEKLNAKRLAKIRAGAAEKNASLLKREGFSDQGITYVVMGNTYEIKDELKNAGAKWNNLIGWHFPEKPENYPTCELSKDTEISKGITLFEEYPTGLIDWSDAWLIQDYIKSLRDKYDASQQPETDYVGEVGKKFEMLLVYTGSASFDTHYTYYGEIQYIHKFMDENGNILIWKTGASLMKTVDGEYKPIEPGEQIKLKGTIKEHSEYKCRKQTVLTRCKIVA